MTGQPARQRAGSRGQPMEREVTQRQLAALARAASGVADAGSWSVTLNVLADAVRSAAALAATKVVAIREGLVPLEYHKDPQRTASVYRTVRGRRCVVVGDWVRYEADGTLRFLGRDSGVINTGGEKVYPAEVEEALLAHPAVIDAVVVGEPDHTGGERVAAVLALRRDAVSPTERELVDWLRPRLAGYKLPRRLLLVAALPRTTTGKLEVSRVRELLHEVGVAVTVVDHPITR